ncbi:hypothetical protein [Enterococcus rivorum]|uniref:Uncharacterized protein n=2 Tax=Enterococcus rivorum TaxID=762845 RepID=A0A1E5L078_9ENTE|nr:hypothetical protein [Enterococcus rivorum]MBP2098843.1 hypothetical protein [Enterococcus rivorum]OEH83572.1 hypothetical protein BCR26_08825 [Enterococcus rivorum]
MKQLTDLEIIDLMEEVENQLMEKYNATIVLTGYGKYLETFNNYDAEIQQLIVNKDVKKVFNKIETNSLDYFDIVFN